ncbi:MAG: hypothetical protein HOH74_25180 [Gemmatimonadetes bacterium]|jgi:hypothetical protein|nr:hypothetical protein [Gemmatimonadota bacterium]
MQLHEIERQLSEGGYVILTGLSPASALNAACGDLQNWLAAQAPNSLWRELHWASLSFR